MLADFINRNYSNTFPLESIGAKFYFILKGSVMVLKRKKAHQTIHLV